MTTSAQRSARTWRAALGLGGVLFLVGGSQHPSGPNDEGTRIELATMMEDDAWYLSHALILAGAALVALGLYGAWRRGAWASSETAARWATIAWGLLAIESLFHLFSAIDADRLRAEEFAPIAYTHLVLAVVVYPLAGLTLARLAIGLFGSWPVPARVFAVGAIVGGLAMACSTPLAVFTDVETDPFFMLGGILPALWAVTAAIVGEHGIAGEIDVRDTTRTAVSA